MKKTRHDNVMIDGRRLYTVNLVPGKTVYGERVRKEKGKELRHWDPSRSKLGAAIMKNMSLPKLKRSHSWLYLGASSGTTVSHVSDIVDDGKLFALEFAPRVMRELHFLAEERVNIAPIFADANDPDSYYYLVTAVDVLFQDIAQREQVRIFLKNLRFLKEDGIAILSCKSRSIDVAAKPKDVFRKVEKDLKQHCEVIEHKTLEPFEHDHAVFLCKKR